MTTAVLDQHDRTHPSTDRAAAGPSPWRVTVLDDFAAARALWERLTASGHATPYQGFAWSEAYFRLVDAPARGRLAVITISDAAGQPVLVAPLAVRRKGPLRIARFLGGKHSNFNMPLCADAAATLDGAALRGLLNSAGREAGIDLFAFASQPFDWEGYANPFARLGGRPSPSAGYKLALAADGEALLTEHLSKDARKKLRQKESKLAQMGPIAHVQPRTPAEVRAVFADFLKLKAARFQSQGIDDPFEGDDIRAFLDAVATGESAAGRALELHALTVGGRTVAVYGGVADRDRFCGLFTAFDSAPDIARCSPGDILLMAIIRDACRRGLKTFDLGVGEARYKAQVCDQTEALFDTFLPVTLAGRLAALTLAQATAAKRWAKHSPAMTALLARYRQLKARAAG